MEKLNLTVSGKRQQTVIQRDVWVNLGELYQLHFDSCHVFIYPQKITLCPSGVFALDNGITDADRIKKLLKNSIEQIEKFDKEAALAELKQALEQVDEIVELVK